MAYSTRKRFTGAAQSTKSSRDSFVDSMSIARSSTQSCLTWPSTITTCRFRSIFNMSRMRSRHVSLLNTCQLISSPRIRARSGTRTGIDHLKKCGTRSPTSSANSHHHQQRHHQHHQLTLIIINNVITSIISSLLSSSTTLYLCSTT